ncbi:hypothetical protein BD289DRAFT_409962 [Coniella lustricola]|uniref:Uncharacterized protein n=1 Tax=Coniella lustricola TaxID=2025994 RepID=A0A2T3A761_9PEZI|nr:hypothetical protein BD289DRAFT_409962 [Coniella lustricola]
MEVIPATAEDQFDPVNNIRTRTFFVLDELLDSDLLRSGLNRLIRIYWRKLGARLVKRRRGGGLEYHLPAIFEDDYQLFEWSIRNDEQPIVDAIPLIGASTQGGGISLLPSMDTVDAACRPSSWPYERKDEPPSAPLLYVHLTLFSDSTVIAISCPHMMADQQGLANIIKAWLQVVDGKKPPPMTGFNENILPKSKPYTAFEKNQVVRKGKIHVRRPFERLLVVLGFLPELILHPKELTYTLFVPLSLLKSLRERYTKELAGIYASVPALSYGDIVTAIAIKLSRLGDQRPKTITFTQTVNMRNRIPSLLGQRAEGYIHNALIYSSARFPIDQSTPISEIAYRNRQSINEVLQDDSIEIELAVIREMVRRGQTMHNCEVFEHSYSISNWASAWKDLDFSPAIWGSEKGTVDARPKFLVFGGSQLKMSPKRFASLITCRNDAGFWCEYSVSSQKAKRIRQYLATDPTLQNL